MISRFVASARSLAFSVPARIASRTNSGSLASCSRRSRMGAISSCSTSSSLRVTDPSPKAALVVGPVLREGLLVEGTHHPPSVFSAAAPSDMMDPQHTAFLIAIFHAHLAAFSLDRPQLQDEQAGRPQSQPDHTGDVSGGPGRQ